MKHKIGFNKLNRVPAHRKALLRNMTTVLFKHERIVTTRAKAKEVRREAEKMITRAKAAAPRPVFQRFTGSMSVCKGGSTTTMMRLRMTMRRFESDVRRASVIRADSVRSHLPASAPK